MESKLLEHNKQSAQHQGKAGFAKTFTGQKDVYWCRKTVAKEDATVGAVETLVIREQWS